MIHAILGKKIAQSQRFLEDGTRIPVTVLSVPDASVVQLKTADKDGYTGVQLGFGKTKTASKPVSGHLKKAQVSYIPSLLKEVRLSSESALPQLGDMIKVEDVLELGDIVKVTGISKGKGFAGGVKRYHFKGGPRTHGQSDRERAPGSIGQTTTPGRVYKGKRMAGRMGHAQVTVANLWVADITTNGQKVLMLSGLVPGSINSIVTIEKTGTKKKFVPLFKTETDKQADEVKQQEEVKTQEKEETVTEEPKEQAKEEKKDGNKE